MMLDSLNPLPSVLNESLEQRENQPLHSKVGGVQTEGEKWLEDLCSEQMSRRQQET